MCLSKRVRRWAWVFSICLVCCGVTLPAPGQTDSSQAAADQSAGASAPQVQVAPKEYESPRASLTTFLQNMKKLAADPEQEEPWERVYGTLDLPTGLGEARKEAAWRLYGIFNHLGRIDPPRMAPGKKELEREKDQKKQNRFEFLPDNPRRAAQTLMRKAIEDLDGKAPPAALVLAKDDSGVWRFASETLDNVNQLYSWIEPRGVQHGTDIEELSVSEWLRRHMPKMLKNSFILGVELWQWLGLLVVVFVAVVADLLSRLVLRAGVSRVVQRYVAEPSPDTVRFAVRPMGLAIAAVVFRWLLQPLGLAGVAMTVLSVAAAVVLAVGAVWAAWAVTGVVTHAWLERARKTATPLDEMLVPLVGTTVKLFIILVGLVYVADSLDLLKFFAPLLAGFGVAGLAVSFAAQDMVKNLFGGLAIFMDRPFRIGDRIVVKGVDGVVDRIGFRVIRLRTLAGHLVTMPNNNITNEPVENIGRRPTLRRILNVTITYDTPKKKIEEAVQIVRDIFEEDGIREPIHPTTGRDYLPPRVFFNDFNADSLNIFVIYWYAPPDWWAYMEHAHRVNLRIFEEFEKAGIEFAFPTQTLYLAGDSKRELALKLLRRDLEQPTAGA